MKASVAILLSCCTLIVSGSDLEKTLWKNEYDRSLVSPSMASEAQIRGFMLYSNGRVDSAVGSVDATVTEIIRDVNNVASNKAYLNVPPQIMNSDFGAIREWFTKQGTPIATLNSTSSVVTAFVLYSQRLVHSLEWHKGMAFRRLSVASIRSGSHRSMFNYFTNLFTPNKNEKEWAKYLEDNILSNVYSDQEVQYQTARIHNAIASLNLYATVAKMPSPI